jgi:hypothetical protein
MLVKNDLKNMNPFEKVRSQDASSDDHLPEMPDLGQIPLTPEIKRAPWDKNNPDGVREIIDGIKREEEDDKKREEIIDDIIERRDKPTLH